MHTKSLLSLIAAAFPAADAWAQDFVVPANTSVTYDTSSGQPLTAANVIVEPGGTLRVVGPYRFVMRATNLVHVEGTIDLSGFKSVGVNTLNTTNITELGATGVAGGGRGGNGNPQTTKSSAKGGDGAGPYDADGLGGRGGETGFSMQGAAVDLRRGGGGGGGALAADQPVDPDPESPLNVGLIALAGNFGGPSTRSAVSLAIPALGGSAGARIFLDGNAANDFWGRKLDVSGILTGELAGPVPGRGGGAGGNASFTNQQIFPKVPFDPTGDEKGAAGGGGGGLGMISARRIVIVGNGSIRANGGEGGGGENTNFLNRVGGGSGGGSGGYLVLQAPTVDLSLAHPNCLSAIGGRGGPGKLDDLDADTAGRGGHGGPGVIQLHVFGGLQSQVIVPAGKSVADMSSPDAHVLLPEPLP